MKLRSKIILSVLLVLITAVATIFAILMPKEKSNVYSAYVDINPLIKLDFKVSCKNDKCEAPVVVGYEFMNDDAKEIYKDLFIKDKPLKETIELLATTVKGNNIAFKEVHIYTNYNNEEEFKIDSIDYEIKLDIKKNEEFEQEIAQLITEDANKKTKEILVPVSFSKSTADNHLWIRDFIPLEYKELFTSISSQDKHSYAMSYNYVKIMVSGPADIINNLPEKYIISEELYGTSYIYGMVDTTGLEVGTYDLILQFYSDIDGVEVLTPNIKCQLKIVTWDEKPIVDLELLN